MAIDVFTEEVLTFPQAAKRLPHLRQGKKIHTSTIWRWTVAGKKCPDGSVAHLETVKIGGTICTSLEALQRFFDRLTGDREIVTPPTFTFGSNHEATHSSRPSSRTTKQHQEMVNRQLDDLMGIKRCEACGAEINTGKCSIPKGERLWCPKCVVQRKSATLGLRIRIFRWSAQLSQLELSSRTGISIENLRAYESDERKPSEFQFGKLIEVLGSELVIGLKGSSEGGCEMFEGSGNSE